MVSSTSLTISGSSAEVGSSNSMIFGFMQSARAIATRCCWPPESWPGIFGGLLGDLDALEIVHRDLLGVLLRHLAHPDRRQRQVLQHGQMREQVEVLEHHADVAAHLVDLLDVVGQLDAVDHDAALLVLLEPVDAADHGRFAGARRPADHDALALGDPQVDVAQHVEIAVPLVDADQLDRDAGLERRGLQPGCVRSFSMRHPHRLSPAARRASTCAHSATWRSRRSDRRSRQRHSRWCWSPASPSSDRRAPASMVFRKSKMPTTNTSVVSLNSPM